MSFDKFKKEYIPLVKYIASRVMFAKNKYMEYEDLVSYGMIGLIDAINKAKPASLKGQYIKSATLTSTMGPGVKLNVTKITN